MTLPLTNRHHLRPHYDEPSIDLNATQHLFIAEEGALPMLQALLSAIKPHLKKSLVVTDLDISPVSTPAYQLVPRVKATTYTDAFLLANAHDAAVYIAGTESFIWQTQRLVVKAGVAKDRIHMLRPISDLRRVICTHCFTVMDNVDRLMTTCSGCQRELEVQDQFSEVHGAYAASGVRISNDSKKDDTTLF